MIETLLLFIPVITCIIWIALHSVLASRTDTFGVFVSLLAFSGLLLLTTIFYGPTDKPQNILTWLNLLTQLTAPCIIPLGMMYLRQLRLGAQAPYTNFVWIVFPVVLLTASLIITSITGSEMVEDFLRQLYEEGDIVALQYRGTPLYFFYIWSVIIYRSILAVEFLIMLIYIVIAARKDHFSFRNLWRFIFKKGRIRVTELQTAHCFLCLLVFPQIFFLVRNNHDLSGTQTVIITLTATIMVFILSYNALFGAKETISIKEMKGAMRYNYRRGEEGRVLEELVDELVDEAETQALMRLKDKIGRNLNIEAWKETDAADDPPLAANIFSAVADSWDENSLTSRFQQLMTEEQMFLQPNLSLGDVAEKLHSNKTYVSKLVNNTYNLGFPELINTLRIDYAEQYIMSHRDAKQDEIARACGFTSASTFNNTFKKVTGMTPKEWERHATIRGDKKR